MTKQILILGGGPAGTATALTLCNHAPSYSVTVVESSNYEEIRIGETLPPQVQQLLMHLDIWPAFLQRNYMPALGTSAAWGSRELHTNEFFTNIHNRGWHLDRRDFDAFLATASEKRGVSVYTKTKMIAQQRCQNRWLVTLRNQEGDRIEKEADFIVDATGRLAAFARQQEAKKEYHDQLVGLFRFFDVDTSYVDSTTLVEAGEDGWWYSSLLPNSQLVMAYMSDRDIVGENRLKSGSQWLEEAQKTTHTHQRLLHSKADLDNAPPRIHAAHTQQLDKIIGDGWLAVGDAATTFDPLSSQGVFKALRSGIFAAYAISDYLQGDEQALNKYEHFVCQEFAGYRKTWQTYYSQEQRWPTSVFWQRRHR